MRFVCYFQQPQYVLFFYPTLQTGSTALFFASQQGHHDVVKLLFEFGASTEFQTKVCCRDTGCDGECYVAVTSVHDSSCGDKETEMMHAVYTNLYRNFLFLCYCFSYVFLWQDGGTALTVASQYGHAKVVDTLLKNGANVHDQLNVSSLFSLSVLPHGPALNLVV